MDSDVIKKTGLENPKGFCFLNSVIQVLYGCKDFSDAVLKYHENSEIQNTKEEDGEKVIFVIHFCTLLHKLKKNENIDEQLREIQNYFSSSSTGDDVYKCFMNLLSIINDVIVNPGVKKSQPRKDSEKEPNNNSESLKNNNNGFVFDCFCGKLLFKMTCQLCNHPINENYQIFKSLPLPVPETDEIVQLLDCINMFFEKSIVNVDNSTQCHCQKDNKILSECKITSCPKYLFIYLDRGSLILEGAKTNTFIKCSEVITITTQEGNVDYRLISVIDHLGTNTYGHYYCKCNYEEDNWWLLNDSQVTRMDNCDIENIVTKDTIAFMFKKF